MCQNHNTENAAWKLTINLNSSLENFQTYESGTEAVKSEYFIYALDLCSPQCFVNI